MMNLTASNIKKHIVITGTGNAASLLVPMLIKSGYCITLLTRSEKRAKALKNTEFLINNIITHEVLQAVPDSVTTDASSILQKTTVVILAIPMSGWESYLIQILPHLQPNSFIISLQSQSSLNLMVRDIQHRLNLEAFVFTLVSCDFLPFTCRSNPLLNDRIVTDLFWIKDFTNVVVSPKANSQKISTLIKDIIPKKIIRNNHGLELLLASSNASMHVPIVLGLYEQQKTGLLPDKLYHDVTDTIVDRMEQLNVECQSIIKCIQKSYSDFCAPYAGDMLSHMTSKYQSLLEPLSVKNLGDFFRKNPAYQEVYVPIRAGKLDIQARYFNEDVPFVMVPIWDVAQLFFINTPILKQVILDAQKIMGKEYITFDNQMGKHFLETSAPRRFGITTTSELMVLY